MALIACPNCGKQISDSAELCIHCGFVLPKKVDATKKRTYTEHSQAERDALVKEYEATYPQFAFREAKKRTEGYRKKICVGLFVFICFTTLLLIGFFFMTWNFLRSHGMIFDASYEFSNAELKNLHSELGSVFHIITTSEHQYVLSSRDGDIYNFMSASFAVFEILVLIVFCIVFAVMAARRKRQRHRYLTHLKIFQVWLKRKKDIFYMVEFHKPYGARDKQYFDNVDINCYRI